MRTIYLRNGNAAYLHKELPDGEYLIEPIYQYDGQDGEYESGNGQKEIVTEIFDKAPVELIYAEYSLAQEARGKLTDEISMLLTDRNELLKEIQDNTRLRQQQIADYEIDRTHDDLLTPAQIEGKRARKAQQIADDIAKHEQAIEQAQNAILKLKGE